MSGRPLEGRTVVITGGTGGIGYHTALGMAEAGAEVVLTGRDARRGKAAATALRTATGARVHLVLGDLSECKGIEAVAARILERFERIDVLVNNAGSLSTEATMTADGFDLDFAVNVVAPVRLTRALLSALRAAEPARVINVTGGMPSSKLDPSGLENVDRVPGLGWYSHTKRAMEAASLQLAEELAPAGVYVNIVYPGGASTAMTQAITPSMVPWFMRWLWPLFRWMMRPDGGASAEKAARSSIWAATDPSLTEVSGGYFDPKSRPAELHRTVRDPENQRWVMRLVDRDEGGGGASPDVRPVTGTQTR